MVVNIELDEAAQRRLLYSVAGRPDGERYPLLLEANYLGHGTALERFINLTEDWTKRLQAAESEPAANTDAPPPQGGIRA